MNVNGKVRLIDLTKPGRERMYLAHEAKGHEIPVALGNTMAIGSSNSDGLGSPSRCQEAGCRGHRGRCGGTPTWGAS